MNSKANCLLQFIDDYLLNIGIHSVREEKEQKGSPDPKRDHC